jgi:hypothetical protein
MPPDSEDLGGTNPCWNNKPKVLRRVMPEFPINLEGNLRQIKPESSKTTDNRTIDADN